MNRLLACWFLALIAFFPSCALAKSEFDVKVKHQDGFYASNKDTATPATQSRTFDIHFRVLDVNEMVDEADKYWMVKYQLFLANKTDRPLHQLRITSHFNEQMQALLVNSTWYNEAIDVGPLTEKDYTNAIEYDWQAMVDLISVGMVDDLKADTFYDIIIEIQWEGGCEVIMLNRSSDETGWPIDEIVDASPIDDETVERIMASGIEQRIIRYGE